MSRLGIKDSEFIRGKVPMTKEEIRVITISKLDLNKNDVVLDVGAGTGGLSIEASPFCKKIYAIERNEEGVALIEANKKKFNCENIEIIHDLAPEGYPDAPINKVMIGGSGGKMEGIIRSLNQYAIEKVVINTITIENTYLAMKILKEHGYSCEVVTVQISKSRNVGQVTMMMGQNPIQIITGEKHEN